MDIFVSSDSNYLKYLKVLMASTYVNHPPELEINFYVLHSALTEEEQAGVREFAQRYGQKAFFVYVDETKYQPLFDKFCSERWSTACLYILFAHELLPLTARRALYLDIDAVVNGDLTEFYALDFDDCYLIASKDGYNAKNEPEHEFEAFERRDRVDLSDAVKGTIFNSGVLLFNLEKFRADAVDVNYYLKALRGAKSEDIFFDQGVLNAAFATRTKLLTTCKYNYRIRYSAQDYFKRSNERVHGRTEYTFYPVDPKIVHYCGKMPGGSIKPWSFYWESLKEIGDPDKELLKMIPECIPYYNIWWKYAEPTPDFEELRQTARMNTAAYRMLRSLTSERRQEFCNRLGLDSFYVPVQNSILKGDDLNSFTKPKVYRCVTAEVKETVKHLPEAFTEKCGFRLTVKHIAANGPGENNNATLQILEPNVPDAAIYRRYCGSPRRGTWQQWYRMATTDDLTPLREQQDQQAQALEKLTKELADIRGTLLSFEGGLQSKGGHPELEAELALTKRALEASKTELSNVKASASFRLGHALTLLPRTISGWLKKRRTQSTGTSRAENEIII